MPAPRKIDLSPAEFKKWLQEAFKESGFSEYEKITLALIAKLANSGNELRIARSSLKRFGKASKDYAQSQKVAQEQMAAFLDEVNLRDEIDITSALFQQLTTIAWRLNMATGEADNLPDARAMKDLTTALNNLVRSTALRGEIIKAYEGEQDKKLGMAVKSGAITENAAMRARQILGLAP